MGAKSVSSTRPAWYSLAPGGWRDYITLLHLPYTLWHLSYVAVGAALAPELRTDRLGWTLLAFFLAMGVGAHALDELQGRPLETSIPGSALVGLAAGSIGGAVAIGIWAGFAWTAWLLPCVALGGFLVVAYNLELFGGRFHDPVWFALGWGAFPVLTAFLASAERLALEAVLAGLFALLTSLVQQQLSAQVRLVRRRVRAVSGRLELWDAEAVPVTTELLLRAPERALQTLAVGMVTLALALIVLRL